MKLKGKYFKTTNEAFLPKSFPFQTDMKLKQYGVCSNRLVWDFQEILLAISLRHLRRITLHCPSTNSTQEFWEFSMHIKPWWKKMVSSYSDKTNKKIAKLDGQFQKSSSLSSLKKSSFLGKEKSLLLFRQMKEEEHD